MDSIKSGFTQIIYPRSYSKTPQQQQAHPAFYQTSKDLDSSKLEHTWFNNLPLFDEDKSLVACVVFDWIWSSSSKTSIYTIQCFLQQQVRCSHVENNIPDKQSVVYTKQSVVSISRSRNNYDIRDFSSFKQFKRKIHKNQSILPLFVFTNRL